MIYQTFINLLNNDKNVAYKFLYETFNSLIFSTILNYTKNRDDVNDLSQDVWIKIYLNIDKYKGGNFKLWLITLCHRVCIDNYRRKKSHKANYNTLNINDYDFLDDKSDLYESKYSKENLINSEIAHSLNKLTEMQQDLILLKLKGLTYKEISQLINENRFTTCIKHKNSITELTKQLESKGVVKSIRINKKKNHYESPNHYKVYMEI